MKKNTIIYFVILCAAFMSLNATNDKSNVWVPDLGNGAYKNPVLYSDYSDPDICRVGNDYYMTSSSFNCIPGLPILHSTDLINWKIINHAIERMPDYANFKKTVNHGGGVWAPSIRFHNGEFYIYYGDPDIGIFMTKTKNPKDRWEPLVLVKEGKGLIDPCPLFDDDGNVYLVFAYAGSRAGIKSVLAMTRLSHDGKKEIGEAQIVFDGHETDPTIEGPKLYKRNGYYYIFAPAGGVKTGWQLALRSKNIFGSYERKVVLAQGNTDINGPHQGGWVDTPEGENWFVHFQDVGPLGRLVHLQPMTWKNDWPVMGINIDKDGTGEPVKINNKPAVKGNRLITTPQESDEFNTNKLGLQWQWHGNPEPWWYFTNQEKDNLTLFSVPLPENYKNLWDVPNLLLQKIPAPEFTATMKIAITPNPGLNGERTGLLVMGRDYALLSILNKGDNFFELSQIECISAEKGQEEQTNESVEVKNSTLFLRIKVKDGYSSFSYSHDNKRFINIGKKFKIREGHWIGAKIGTFFTRPVLNNDGGWVEIDWFRIEK